MVDLAARKCQSLSLSPLQGFSAKNSNPFIACRILKTNEHNSKHPVNSMERARKHSHINPTSTLCEHDPELDSLKIWKYPAASAPKDESQGGLSRFVRRTRLDFFYIYTVSCLTPRSNLLHYICQYLQGPSKRYKY